ncbi:MAG: DUF2155 domain-containing protein [Geobacteraceae bacterium]|nr:DUF2155 domain-containing protein [Geobacteraceae bacterium]
MYRTRGFFAVALITVALFAGCTKSDENKAVAPDPHDAMMAQPVIVVPDTVKGKWKSVKIAVLDKSSGKSTDYDIAIGSKVAVPDSDLVIAVDTFFPDFVMDGATRTSRSNEPKNPAAQIRVEEKGTEIYKNWLFALLKTPHAFQHPKYELSLTGYSPSAK